ncbi:MAG: acyl-CoA dehydratase activase [Candidatus Nezhaarchaeales archaeon]
MGEAPKEYWRWPEYRWVNPDIDWTKGKVITAGVDVGSVSSKAAIMVDGEIFAYDYMRTGSSSSDSAIKAMNWILEAIRPKMTLKDIHYVVGTGYGRVNVPFAKRAITEIACHARGANYLWGPTVRTVLDVGGQDIKAIRCDEKGKVISFLMNDKCAAGTGRGMEVFADLLGVPIQDIGHLSLSVKEEPPPVSNTCVVFARNEASALLRQGWPKEKVAAAYHLAMAMRMVELLQRLGVEPDLVITGGQSKNVGIVTRVTRLLGIKPLPNPTKPGYDPVAAGAIGAALFAKALYEKERKA